MSSLAKRFAAWMDQLLSKTTGTDGITDNHRPRDLWADLERFPWLTPVRKRIEDVVAAYEQARHNPALAVTPEGLHLLLVAPPGLGRFRVAHGACSMLSARGHLRRKGCQVTFAKNLVSDWIGQARSLTMETCKSALDAMLLIQYPSVLVGHPFSSDAVNALIEFMDANKGRIVIAMIFEPGELPAFADAYPELVSRFHRIEFPIPGLKEQLDFLRELATQHNCLLPDDLEPLLGPWIERHRKEDRWAYMRQIGRLLGEAANAWVERNAAPRGPDGRYQIPDGLTLERVDFERAMVLFDGSGNPPAA